MATIHKLVLGFVTLILGVVLLSQVATVAQGSITVKQTQVNDSISVAAAKILAVSINTTYPFPVTYNPTGWKTTDCPLTGITVENTSGQALTVTTDYTLNAANGTMYLKNTSAVFNQTADNITYVTYVYCADDYINLSWGRTMTNLVSGFFAIALLLTSIGIFYSLAKETGILNV